MLWFVFWGRRPTIANGESLFLMSQSSDRNFFERRTNTKIKRFDGVHYYIVIRNFFERLTNTQIERVDGVVILIYCQGKIDVGRVKEKDKVPKGRRICHQSFRVRWIWCKSKAKL